VNDLTKRDVAITAAGIIIAAVLVSILAWCFVRVFAPSDPRDPLCQSRRPQTNAGHSEGQVGRESAAIGNASARTSPLLIRMHLFVQRDLSLLRELDHMHRRGIAALPVGPAFQRRLQLP
jgi:hypothetical protein